MSEPKTRSPDFAQFSKTLPAGFRPIAVFGQRDSDDAIVFLAAGNVRFELITDAEIETFGERLKMTLRMARQKRMQEA